MRHMGLCGVYENEPVETSKSVKSSQEGFSKHSST